MRLRKRRRCRSTSPAAELLRIVWPRLRPQTEVTALEAAALRSVVREAATRRLQLNAITRHDRLRVHPAWLRATERTVRPVHGLRADHLHVIRAHVLLGRELRAD